MKILLAIDGSPCSDAAIQEVIRRPWPPQSEVKIIVAVETPMIVGTGFEPWPADYFNEVMKTAREGAQSVIEKAIRKFSDSADKTLKISHEIIGGPPSQIIVEDAEKWDADLIVMGSRGLGAWNRLMLGSVSNAVVHHAKCSVEVVRTLNTK